MYDYSIKLYIRNTKYTKDFDLNVDVDRGFDPNKYPNDGEEAFGEKELQQVVQMMLKIYLPNFYYEKIVGFGMHKHDEFIVVGKINFLF